MRRHSRLEAQLGPLHEGGAKLTREALLAARRRDLRARDEDASRRELGLLLSVLVGVLLQLALVNPGLARFFAAREAPATTEVRVVSRKDLRRAARPLDLVPERAPRPPPSAPERRAEDEPEVVPGQVVRIAPPAVEERPKAADYAAEWDSATDRETRARDPARLAKNVTRAPQLGRDVIAEAPPPAASPEAAPAPPSPGGGPAGPGQAERGDEGDAREDGATDEPTKLAMEIPRVTAQEKLALDEAHDGDMANRAARTGIEAHGTQLKLSLGRELEGIERELLAMTPRAGEGRATRGGAGREGLPSLAALTPSLVELERITGAPANDFLPDVETDAETRLNAWRWKHATFFNRVADGVRRTWAGPEVLAARDPTGSVYGTGDVMTVLAVTLDRSGNVVDVMVQEPSGVDVMDDEAVRSFRAAGPFPNPPAALFAGGERFTFTFGFNVGYDHRDIDLNWRPY